MRRTIGSIVRAGLLLGITSMTDSDGFAQTSAAAPGLWEDQFRRAEQALVRGQYFDAAQTLASVLKSLDGVPETDLRIARTVSRLGAARFLLGDLEGAGSLLRR